MAFKGTLNVTLYYLKICLVRFNLETACMHIYTLREMAEKDCSSLCRTLQPLNASQGTSKYLWLSFPVLKENVSIFKWPQPRGRGFLLLCAGSSGALSPLLGLLPAAVVPAARSHGSSWELHTQQGHSAGPHLGLCSKWSLGLCHFP